MRILKDLIKILFCLDGKCDILKYVKDIFKALEVLDEIHVEEVSIEKDEASFGPIKSSHGYYKSTLPSRLDKIHYKVRITPNEETTIEPIELGGVIKDKKITADSFIKEGDIYINKLIDNCFYINEGVRYFLIYQIVDNSTYGTGDCVSLKSLLMPITLKANKFVAVPEYGDDPVELKNFETLLFSKRLNPLLYSFAKDSYNILAKHKSENMDNLYEEWQNIRDDSLIKSFNEFYNVNFKFNDDPEKLKEDGRLIFRVKTESKNPTGVYVSVEKDKLNDSLTSAVLGSLLDIKNETKKRRISFSYDELISPWFWIEKVAPFFTKNSDYVKKFNKIRTMLISLDRLIDSTTSNILNLHDKDKENTLAIIRYIMKNFDSLLTADSQDLGNKRIRLYEYQLYSLRKYFSDQIYHVLNSPTRSRAVLERIFSNLSPMFVIKQTVTNELLRYYNSTNEMNLYSSLLKYTFRGPQSLSKTVSVDQRDIHPSYVGRLSLIASSASDPGMSGSLTPFIEEYDYYFKKQEE